MEFEENFVDEEGNVYSVPEEEKNILDLIAADVRKKANAITYNFHDPDKGENGDHICPDPNCEGKRYRTRKGYRTHVREKHRVPNDYFKKLYMKKVAERSMDASVTLGKKKHYKKSLAKSKTPMMSCPLSDDCPKMLIVRRLTEHIRDVHNEHIEEFRYKFPSWKAFEAWKLQLEQDTDSWFRISAGNRGMCGDNTKMRNVFHCHKFLKTTQYRSDCVPRRKKLRTFCPARINSYQDMQTGEVEIYAVLSHFGHGSEAEDQWRTRRREIRREVKEAMVAENPDMFPEGFLDDDEFDETYGGEPMVDLANGGGRGSHLPVVYHTTPSSATYEYANEPLVRVEVIPSPDDQEEVVEENGDLFTYHYGDDGDDNDNVVNNHTATTTTPSKNKNTASEVLTAAAADAQLQKVNALRAEVDMMLDEYEQRLTVRDPVVPAGATDQVLYEGGFLTQALNWALTGQMPAGVRSAGSASGRLPEAKASFSPPQTKSKKKAMKATGTPTVMKKSGARKSVGASSSRGLDDSKTGLVIPASRLPARLRQSGAAAATTPDGGTANSAKKPPRYSYLLKRNGALLRTMVPMNDDDDDI